MHSKPLTKTRAWARTLALLAGACGLAGAAQAEDAPPAHDHAAMMAHDHAAMAGHEGHEGHDMSAMREVKLSSGAYELPAVSLTRQDGKKVALAKALDDGRPVVLNFIYTSCTAICPVTSQVFSEFREQLGAQRNGVNMVSISIDPEFDTPQRLAEYAGHYKADAAWQFYTGSLQDSIAVQKAFATYRGDKMNHTPVTFMRPAPGKPWVRVEGLAGPTQLMAAYRKMTAKS
jgi:protein SCO1/2